MKIVVVTGASTGIGRAVAIEFAKTGATIILTSRRKDKLEETAKVVEKSGGKADIFVADMSSVDDVDKLIKDIESKYSGIDILCNIAGIWHGESEVYADKNLEDFDTKVIVDTFNVETLAPTLLAHGLIPMIPRGGSIINISGTFENGAKGWLPYYVSKRAIEDLTIGLSEELMTRGIKVNCVSPSDTATEEYIKFFPEDAADAQTPEQVAEFFVELADRDVTGKVFVVKNGQVSEGFHK